MKCHGCGEEVPDWMRYHWIGANEGHYTEADPRAPKVRTKDPEGRPANIVRASVWWDDNAIQLAPHPGSVPAKPWPSEDELRIMGLDLLQRLGYDVSDLEQGYRGQDGREGTSRVRLGLPDAYVTHHRLQVRAWIEFKRWDNEPQPDQVAFGEQEIAAGGCYLVVYEVGQLAAWHENVRRYHTTR